MKSSIFKNTRLALALPFVLAFAGTSFATKGDLGGASYDGTEAKPYQISDAADLMAFAEKVNVGEEYGAWAVLTGDICMNACNEGESVLKDDGTLNGTEFTPWTPIGSTNSYIGTFDGKEFAISGLYFDNSTDNVGLFGKIGSSAVIQNVGVVDSYFRGSFYVGGVVGYSEGSVSNSYNAGAVSGDTDVGGIAGYSEGSVSNSYNAGTVSGYTEDVGGIAGESYGTISNSYNAGTVSGNSHVGGIAGNSKGPVSNSYNAGAVSGDMYVGGVAGRSYTIRNSYNAGTVSGKNSVGGIAGVSYGTIRNSYNDNAGTVSGDIDVGGVAGENYGAISDSYNAGAVSGYTEDVGGVVGFSEGFGSVRNSYNAGTVSGKNSVGGIAGVSYGTIRNSYNDNAGTVSGDIDVGGVVGFSSAEGSVSNSYNAGTVSGKNSVGGIAGVSYGTISNSYNAGAVSGDNKDVGSLVGGNYGSNVNSYFNTSVTCENCSTNEGIGMSAEKFHSGEVAELLHDWCEKDGDNCKEGGLNGSIWGQNLQAENSLPDFSGVIGSYGGVAFVGLKDGTAASAHIDATSDASVSIPEDIKVTGEIKIERSFAWKGYSTIMLPFQPKFNSDADTIADVNFYKFATYANDKIEVNPISQKDLERNTPYLVSAAGATELVFKNGGTFNTVTGDAYNSKTGEYKVELGGDGAGWSIYGTYDYKTWEKGDAGLGKTYGFAGSNGYDPNVVGLFKKVGAGAYTFPMRAYLEYEIPVKKVRTAPNSARAAASVTASLPETIDVMVVEKDAKTGEETTKLIGSINSRTGEFKAVDRYFDLNGRNVGKKPAAKGSFYRK